MSAAAKDLCLELYELTAWETPKVANHFRLWRHYPKGAFEALTLVASNQLSYDFIAPAYDTDFLLTKLPTRLPAVNLAKQRFSPLSLHAEDGRWVAGYHGVAGVDADTPADALAKLAILLHKMELLQETRTEEVIDARS